MPHTKHTKHRATAHKAKCQSVVIQITTTEKLIEVLDCVVGTGFFGNSRAAAAERLLAESLRDLLKEGVITRCKKTLEK